MENLVLVVAILALQS